MLMPLFMIIAIGIVLIAAFIIFKNKQTADYNKMRDVQKKPSQVIHFLDIVYFLKAEGLTDDKKILQALFMEWLKEERIYVSLHPEGKKPSDTAYVFFIPIYEQAPFDNASSNLLMRYCDIHKVLDYFYKPEKRLEKQDIVLAFLNDNPFWYGVYNESKRLYKIKMKSSKTDEKTRDRIFNAIFEVIVPRTIEVYIKKGVDPIHMDMANKSFQTDLKAEVEQQLNRTLQDIESTARYSMQFMVGLKWGDVMEEVMRTSKADLIANGYLKPHENYTDAVVTIQGHKLEKEVQAFIAYMHQFQKSQKEKPLAKNFWDDYLIWGSLLGVNELLHQQMLAVDPTFENLTLFPGKYAQGLYNYGELSIKQNT